ncbi:SDR family oxidoreductase [Chryseobacterium daecheongense]|uniref:Aldehyde reductase n=1 Tax=Chryseobacterium daecheongense TaxID=192389 RepID=A0A3N0W5W1_9FLAO|nr:aldehyde reductase [Chryseobacterium daecheongense]ROI00450.1 aldehyde reductase [Chryseobacterium daecheongense]TDX94580.1 nucleoside-diphosphate-sugar epimerase [Chryseobacterium daecheongense]
MENIKKTVLVTGGTGFLGVHTVLQLLQQGYEVRTTLRSLSKKDSIIKALEEGGITDFSHLSFFEADLTSDNNWDEAVKGCDYVLHVASPFPAQDPKDENELIIPARDGALRVLKTSRDAGVKRVVLTSSFAAVGYSIKIENHVFTEEDWTDVNTALPAYIKSKTVAEKSAWEFVEKEGNGLELAVINPVGIFGPSIGGITSASLDIAVSSILNGNLEYTPTFTMGVVDVRDVADIHIKAMVSPAAAGERFIATSDGVMSFYDVAELFKKERPQYTANIQELEPIGKEFYKEMSNKKARTILNWYPRSREEALLASADSLMANS